MKSEELQKTLFAAARLLPPSDHVPYAFEKRVMAALATQPPYDVWAFWSRLLWRAAAPCVAITIILGAWTVVLNGLSSPSATLAADLDRTVWGPLVALNDW